MSAFRVNIMPQGHHYFIIPWVTTFGFGGVMLIAATSKEDAIEEAKAQLESLKQYDFATIIDYSKICKLSFVEMNKLLKDYIKYEKEYDGNDIS